MGRFLLMVLIQIISCASLYVESSVFSHSSPDHHTSGYQDLMFLVPNEYVDKDGKNHELSENNEYTKLITQYQYLQYNSLMDKKHVSTDLFSVKDGK